MEEKSMRRIHIILQSTVPLLLLAALLLAAAQAQFQMAFADDSIS